MRNQIDSLSLRGFVATAVLASLGCSAVRGVGQATGAAVGAAGSVAGAAVGTAGNVAGAAVGTAGNVAGAAVGTAGNVAGAAVGTAGSVAGAAVGTAGNATGAVAGAATDMVGGTAATGARSAAPADLSSLPHFKTPEAAASALIKATSSPGDEQLLALLGPGATDVLSSGDAVEDRRNRAHFVERAHQRHVVQKTGDDSAVLEVGRDAWPLPIPIVLDQSGWAFDAAAGREEMLNRRIGENELKVLQTVDAYVEAQREYARLDPTGVGFENYAMKLVSSEGTRDGLWWPDEKGAPRSPVGPLIAEASGEGYDVAGSGRREPYHGYYFRILRAQGPSAPGGARSYVTGKLMTGGFALVAWPAKYGVTGIMTFQVNQRGIVYQKDVGPGTAALATGMQTFDPDRSWAPTRVEE